MMDLDPALVRYEPESAIKEEGVIYVQATPVTDGGQWEADFREAAKAAGFRAKQIDFLWQWRIVPSD
jgi:hypothetical protein